MYDFTRPLLNMRGKSKIGTLLTLAVIVAIVYTALKFIPPFVKYLKVKNAAYDTMETVGNKDDTAILDRMLHMSKSDGLGITQENITIERTESAPTKLTIDWSENVVLIKDKLEKKLTFHLEQEAQ